mmetsp:Transcript_384/g.1327  ORF Transcript_384/g.1327 Transcript_384/m.1327 type:complete len:240 (-) Transcript_384:1633-2352(-)
MRLKRSMICRASMSWRTSSPTLKMHACQWFCASMLFLRRRLPASWLVLRPWRASGWSMSSLLRAFSLREREKALALLATLPEDVSALEDISSNLLMFLAIFSSSSLALSGFSFFVSAGAASAAAAAAATAAAAASSPSFLAEMSLATLALRERFRSRRSWRRLRLEVLLLVLEDLRADSGASSLGTPAFQARSCCVSSMRACSLLTRNVTRMGTFSALCMGAALSGLMASTVVSGLVGR